MTETGGWEVVREALRKRVGVSAFDAWFRGLEGSIEHDTLVVRCPDRFSRDWIRGRYHDVLEQVTGASRKIAYHVEAEPDTTVAESAASADRATEEPARPAAPSFDDFIAEPGNVLALEAARAVAGGRAGHCSPLVLTGSAGLGKTHLCRAIRREIHDRALYRSSEEFTTEVTGAIRSHRMDAFRQRYRRSLNILILEDVQFLAGKRATQVELFHTLDHLLSRGKAVVLSAACSPREIEGLDPGLASRMCSGLVARIRPPALETRRAILREKASAGGVRVPEECIELLASRSVQSVRDLLSGLNQVVARAALLRKPVTRTLVAEALAAAEMTGRPRSLAEIIEIVAQAYGVSLGELRSRSRRRSVVRPRQIAMYLARQYTEASLKEIGGAFGRDHSSVLYAVEVVERRLVERPQLRYELETLAGRITPPGRGGSAAGSTRGTRRT